MIKKRSISLYEVTERNSGVLHLDTGWKTIKILGNNSSEISLNP